MNRQANQRTSVSALMGVAIADASGRLMGHVTEFAVAPTVDACRVESLVVRRSGESRKVAPAMVRVSSLCWNDAGKLQVADGAPTAVVLDDTDKYLLLERDLLDQQIIDVHGHKVVRVNDVDMVWEAGDGDCALSLRIAEVEVGIRGAVRRLLKGLPQDAVEALASRAGARVIPWDFVDLIDRDPARRVRLKIEQDRLSKMHPSDLADILEELAPAEGQALFSSLDEEVAAEALEEVELKTQKSLIESLDSETAAGIIEEMDPGAAADLLAELSEERSDAILEEMGEKERHDVEELLEHAPDSAAGLMTTDFVAVGVDGSLDDAVKALEEFDGDLETVTEIFLVDEERLVGQVPMARLMVTKSGGLKEIAEEHVVSTGEAENGRKVAELFDKYNLRSLPVLDEDKKLVGVIRAEHVIGWLRMKH
ncbi:magnesium transporter MgtE N-terminal domain-containing protein [Granulicella tundricola]|uniref:MgtE intracellular region protein n=1 Tax=Granulicella tundricola (strain ATCC BAA-1859 / DSM 23138 / MP5ACTX9) TaxID=1198114 RepID=E8WXJ4_GRATM|nr:CBS domain-containing protein [Granulicella tundricola]ADW68610.1 MgtE intracellular region protein [Granulicella tundricola MP5ACTX9]